MLEPLSSAQQEPRKRLRGTADPTFRGDADGDRASQVLSGKESACQAGDLVLQGKIPRRREWQPTAVFLPGEFHGQRSLAGYSPWYHKESDTTDNNDKLMVMAMVVVMLIKEIPKGK